MPLCEFCSAINVNTIVPYYPPGFGEKEYRVCLDHQPTYNALQESAKQCPLCSLFYETLERNNLGKSIPPEHKMHEESKIWLISGDRAFDDLSLPKNLSNIMVNSGSGGLIDGADLRITTSTDDPLALSGDVIGRKTMSKPGSNESFIQIRGWLENCERNHMNCENHIAQSESSTKTSVGFIARHHSTSLPSRLIDVGSGVKSESVFLSETRQKCGRYAALSYSWGRSAGFSAKSENYLQLLKGFKIADLPTTIQHAITVTRELGLQYLWVDALCIIQDDPTDWAIESAQMDSVYGNSVITIAAAASADKWDGCFRTDEATSESVDIKSICSNGVDIGTMTISPRAGSINKVLDRSPLCSRAWTLQERVLARRTVHFARDQIYWECQTHCVAEDGMTFDDPMAINRCLSMIQDEHLEPFPDVMRRWHLLVKEYSQRNLFKKSDKLPAISGLARQVQRRTGAKYLAGLWEEDLPLALFWKTTNNTPSEEWRAPSWSWASVNGRVAQVLYYVKEILEQLVILDAKVEILNKNNPLGEVKAGKIVAQGRLRQTRRTLQTKIFDYGGWTGNLSATTEYLLDEYDEEGRSIGWFTPDCDSVSEQSLEFFALLIRSYLDGFHVSNDFIGIVKGPGIDTYKRVGMGNVRGEFFKSCAPTIIHLI